MQASEIIRSIQLNELIRAVGNTCLAAFAETLENAPGTSIEEFLTSRPVKDRSELASLIALDLRHRWTNGNPCPIESYFGRFPELQQDHEQSLDLIYAEYCERRQHRIPFESDEYYRRFPDYEQSLVRIFRIDSLFQEDSEEINRRGLEAVGLLEEGDEFLDFELVGQLGQGAFGRVFLAKQTNLSDRLVVVKITPLRTIEHQTLARLEHPNIVPVLSVHPDDLSGLQAVCMPYQGGVALRDVEATWHDSSKQPGLATAFIDAVHKMVPPDLRKADQAVKGTKFPKQESYVYSCAWLMSKLAGALAHAHSRGIYHRDLKPSNILLTATIQPLLVDFNLAFNQSESKGDPKAFFGGTLPYMPPEQLQALHPEEVGKAEDVGPRSDVYSLAATFFELMTGRLPFGLPESGNERLAVLRSQIELRYAEIPSARRLNPQVPSDLNALLSKCLHPSPEQRYESASQLANDLDRFLEDRPLRHVGKIPKRQIAIKFVRRNRRRLVLSLGAVALGVSLVSSVHIAKENSRQAWLEYQNRLDAETARQRVEDELAKTDQELERTTAFLEEQKSENQPGTAEQYIARGGKFLAKQRYAEAEADFAMALKLPYPYKDWALYYHAMSLAGQHKDKEAIKEYTAAIKVNPRFSCGYAGRALTAASSKDIDVLNFDQAVRDARRALEFAEEDPRPENIFFEIARVFIRASTQLPELKEESEELLIRGVKRGLSKNYISFDELLSPFLDRPRVRESISQSNK